MHRVGPEINESKALSETLPPSVALSNPERAVPHLADYRALLDHAEALNARNTSRPLDATRVLDEARDLLHAGLPHLRQQVDRLLADHVGIPATPELFDVLQLTADETRTTMVLRHLLDPKADHGLGHRFLRRFLALGLGDLPADCDLEQLTALKEVPFLHGIPDLVLVHPRFVVVVEVKLRASVHSVPARLPTIVAARERTLPQTTGYRLDLDPTLPTRAATLRHLRRAANTALPDDVPTHFVFLAPADNCDAKDDAYRHVHFGPLATALAQAAEQSHLEPDQAAAIRQVRTHWLRGAVSARRDLVRSLVALRHLRSALEPHPTGGQVLAARRHLRSLRAALGDHP
jgi:hypothetical protein